VLAQIGWEMHNAVLALDTCPGSPVERERCCLEVVEDFELAMRPKEKLTQSSFPVLWLFGMVLLFLYNKIC